ncbi:type III-B CRISPR module RAMP protein Cmr4 [Paenibacillus sp. SYP-B4298]|uniref:type III-B CRISPR module RAMP protein Cmr4 n=1 Tax=Paenibacillus sp. SYP-B4298 TaxID=2996034 RepID=UPI0022DD127C|nr:type III-B CRISPR module RAMP protein Cmr4 [Paenibacillus sp. SYP-B4298]
MFTLHQPFLLHAMTSIHAGSGSEIGHVDLPIQREKHTSYPKIESSSLKGALRHHMASGILTTEQANAELTVVFGSAPKDQTEASVDSNDTQASAVSFLDARILLFPVRSLKGTFVWVTCPAVLQRFNREMRMLSSTPDNTVIQLPLHKVEPGTVSSNEVLIDSKALVLEEYTISAAYSEPTAQLATELGKWLDDDAPLGIEKRLTVLNDDEFTNFVKFSTEVNARIRVEDSGVVEGGLWYEENVPPETIFYSALLIGQARDIRRPAKNKNENRENVQISELKTAEQIELYIRSHFPEVFQLGGSTTIGKGLFRKIWLKEEPLHDI